jgi:hypothetical protein
VFFVEGLQTTIWTDVSSRFDRRFRAWSHTFNGINQKLKAARIFDALPQINPRTGT